MNDSDTKAPEQRSLSRAILLLHLIPFSLAVWAWIEVPHWASVWHQLIGAEHLPTSTTILEQSYRYWILAPILSLTGFLWLWKRSQDRLALCAWSFVAICMISFTMLAFSQHGRTAPFLQLMENLK